MDEELAASLECVADDAGPGAVEPKSDRIAPGRAEERMAASLGRLDDPDLAADLASRDPLALARGRSDRALDQHIDRAMVAA